MAIKSGFFNSLNCDRPYNAEQMSSIFDGIIQDGVYETVGNQFHVTPGTGMRVMVDTGRAWFNHTWTLNDTAMPLDLDSSEAGLNRIDLVVLEINSENETRANSIKIIKGDPAYEPVEPTLIREDRLNQYPLAAIYVPAASGSVTTENITNYVGTTRCPFVIGVLEVMTVDQLVEQWRAAETATFEDWLAHLRHELDEDQIGHLQDQIDAIKSLSSTDIENIWNSVYGGE